MELPDSFTQSGAEVNHRKVRRLSNHLAIHWLLIPYEPKEYTGKIPAITANLPLCCQSEQSPCLYAQEQNEVFKLLFWPSLQEESSGDGSGGTTGRWDYCEGLLPSTYRTMLIQKQHRYTVSAWLGQWHFRQRARWITEKVNGRHDDDMTVEYGTGYFDSFVPCCLQQQRTDIM